MAVVFDAKAPSHTEATAGWNTATAATWTHTPVSTPRGVFVAVVQGGATGDQVTAVTYGGVSMTRVRSDINATAELGRTYLYFLGTGIPTGAQTVSVTSSGTTPKYAVSFTFTASADTYVIASNGADAGVVANPSLTVTFPATYAGWAGVAAHFYGGAAPVTTGLQTGETYANGPDFGALAGMTYYRSNGSSGSSTTFGYTTLTSDDELISAAVIAEDVGISQALYTGPDTAAGAQTGPSWSVTPDGANSVAIGWSGAITPSGAAVSLMGQGSITATYTRSGSAVSHSASVMGVGTQVVAHAKGALHADGTNGTGTQAATHTKGGLRAASVMGAGAQAVAHGKGGLRSATVTGAGTQTVSHSISGGSRSAAASVMGLGAPIAQHAKGALGAAAVNGAGTQTTARSKGGQRAASVNGAGTLTSAGAHGGLRSATVSGTGSIITSYSAATGDAGISQALYTGNKAAAGAQTGPSWSITPDTTNAPSIGWAAALAPTAKATSVMGVGSVTATHTATPGTIGRPASVMGVGTQAVSHAKGVRATYEVGIPPFTVYVEGSLVMGAGSVAATHSISRSHSASVMGVGTQTATQRKGALVAGSVLGQGTQSVAHTTTSGNRNHSASIMGAGTQTASHSKGAVAAALGLGTGTQSATHIKGGVRSVALMGAGTQTASHSIGGGARSHASSLMGVGFQSATHRKAAFHVVLVAGTGYLGVDHGLGVAPALTLPLSVNLTKVEALAVITPNMSSVDITANAQTAAITPYQSVPDIDASDTSLTVDPYNTLVELL